MSAKEWNNDDRCGVALAALATQARYTGNGREDLQTQCGDLIANLMHLAKARDFSLPDAIITGTGHYMNEVLDK